MLRTADLDYELPAHRIATHPVEPRDTAKLLVTRRSVGGRPRHASISDLPGLLRAGDLLVLNRTTVLPARLIGINEDTGAKVQGLYLGAAPAAHGRRWRALLKMRRFRQGARVRLFNRHGEASDVVLVLEDRATDDEGGWYVRVESPDAAHTEDQRLLARVGVAPLPPYILASRRAENETNLPTNPTSEVDHDLAVYQTVFADPAHAASVAAPTAGLHFTLELLKQLQSVGVHTAEVFLQVGMGTFKPVETEYVEQHPMHAEFCTLPAATARAIMQTRAAGGRVIAVGTTAARTLESFADLDSLVTDESLSTRLLITPGYVFRNLDGLLTNFHLPRSTLLALVAALLGAADGVDRLLGLYREAIEREYRFYSFGDAMLVLPAD